MIYTLEPIIPIIDELMPLMSEAWHSVDLMAEHVPLDPDWDLIEKMEAMGMWRTYTVRTDEGKMIGFICVMIQHLLHSRFSKHSLVDVAYIDPKHKGVFSSLLELVESDLRDDGIKSFEFHLKSWDKVGEFMNKKGYTHSENVYLKVIN